MALLDQVGAGSHGTARGQEIDKVLGLKLGVKLPASDQLSFRVAGTFDRGFENDDFNGTNSFGALFGMSVMVGGE